MVDVEHAAALGISYRRTRMFPWSSALWVAASTSGQDAISTGAGYQSFPEVCACKKRGGELVRWTSPGRRWLSCTPCRQCS